MKRRISLLLDIIALIFFCLFFFIIDNHIMEHGGWHGILWGGWTQMFGIIVLSISVFIGLVAYRKSISKEIERPVFALVLSLIGGTLTLIAGVFISWAGLRAYYHYSKTALLYPDSISISLRWNHALILGLYAVSAAIIVTVGSYIIYKSPEKHKRWGIIMLILSVISSGVGVIGALGIVGVILAIEGGALAIAWSPTPTTLTVSTRICLKCGHVIKDESHKFCPFCGKNLEAKLQSK